ncbi:MAG TPA: hypothetical protein VGV14_07100 [Rhodanobacter sp.]|nr:hypothetical protein [Rhodanobacter sp.]
MIDFLVKNKEWLFSGVGVAVLGLIFRALRNRIFPPKSHASPAIVQDARQPPPDNFAQLAPSTPARITKTNTIELTQIIAALEKAPPLQKADVIKHYVGLSVQWETLLWGADKTDDDNVRVVLDFGPNSTKLVYCSVRLSDYRQLGVMDRGTPITVIGRISEVSALSASLEDVQLFFHGTSNTTA